MSNLQLLLSISIPTFAVILATIFNNTRFNSVEQRLITIESDLRRFYEVQGRHEGEIQSLRDRLK